MPLVLANRVQESGTANTTVSFTLTGAVTGFQSFSTIGNGNTTYYSATDASGNWEVGLGLYLATGSILLRTAVYASSNAGSAVTFSGAVNVFVTYPSGKSVNLDDSGNVSALGTVTSGTWQGSTVGVAYGGTGVTASTGANSVVLRDANENITINRLNQGLQTITASGGTTVLTAASDFNQALVGTGGHTYSLPDATTLSDTTAFQFNNNATGTLTITDYASATIGTIAPGGAAGVALLNNSTVGGTWDVHAYIPENVTWGTNALALGTTVISGGTWQGGTIQSGYGGTGLTTFAGANNALYSTSASALAAGTLPVAAGGTGLTSYTLNGVVYASGTGTLATGSALTFDGTNLINSGAYTAPNNGAGAGTKTTITGSTGTGQAGASGGNGFIELVGGGGTSLWTTFGGALARRRGGINLQAGTAQADAGGTYVNGSTINIYGSAGTNNGTLTGFGSSILIQSGIVTKIDTFINGSSNIFIGGANSSSGGSLTGNTGFFNTSTLASNGSSFNFSGGNSTNAGAVTISGGSYTVSGVANNGSVIEATGATATTGGSVYLSPGNATAGGSIRGKAYVKNPATGLSWEILNAENIFTTQLGIYSPNGVVYVGSTGFLTNGTALTYNGTTLTADTASTSAANLRIENGNFNRVGAFQLTTNGVQFDAFDQNSTSAQRSFMWLSGGSEQMRLTGTGLGIGTSSPATKLHVNTGAAGYAITVAASSQTSITYQLGIDSNSNLAFYDTYAAAQRLVLSSSGNLGLGVTPSAWGGSGVKALDIGTAAALSGSGADAGLIANAYYNGSSWIYKTSSLAARYQILVGSGSHAWFTAPSGTAGNAITFTQAMTLDSSGNVGIGTSSPTAKLDVNGGANSEMRLTTSGSGYLQVGQFTNGAFIGTSSTDATAGILRLGTGGTTRATLDSSGNLGIGTSSPTQALSIARGAGSVAYLDVAGGGRTLGTNSFTFGQAFDGVVTFFQRENAAMYWATNSIERARITSGGAFLVGGITAPSISSVQFFDVSANAGGVLAGFTQQSTTATNGCLGLWQKATTGDNVFEEYFTDTAGTKRGSITYNRAGGLVAYNTTSDYRAKDIIGPVANPGVTIDALKVYEGQMKGATQSRPMLVAHEAQAVAPYSVTGEKDAVNEDGTPKFQQMDVSSLVPLLIAEIQSLRQRVAQLEGK